MFGMNAFARKVADVLVRRVRPVRRSRNRMRRRLVKLLVIITVIRRVNKIRSGSRLGFARQVEGGRRRAVTINILKEGI